jgi:hypothetical protein
MQFEFWHCFVIDYLCGELTSDIITIMYYFRNFWKAKNLIIQFESIFIYAMFQKSSSQLQSEQEYNDINISIQFHHRRAWQQQKVNYSQVLKENKIYLKSIKITNNTTKLQIIQDNINKLILIILLVSGLFLVHRVRFNITFQALEIVLPHISKLPVLCVES